MKKQNKKIGKFLYWTPRILSILFVLFLAVFSLDVFDGNYGFWGTILGLFIHNIPSLILLIIIILSWKHELVGGITFILAGLLYSLRILITALENGFEWYYISWSLIISIPAFLIGILWILNWKKKR